MAATMCCHPTHKTNELPRARKVGPGHWIKKTSKNQEKLGETKNILGKTTKQLSKQLGQTKGKPGKLKKIYEKLTKSEKN